MTIHMRAGAAFLVGAMMMLAPQAFAATDLNTEAFSKACNSNEDFLDGLGDDTAALGELCGCVVAGLEQGDLSQADVDMLTKDLDLTGTDEERGAYETYEELSNFAGDTLGICIGGMADAQDPVQDGGDDDMDVVPEAAPAE